MDEGAMPEGSRAKETIAENSDDDSWEAATKERMLKNNKS